jgi:hypothetical protein
LLECVDFLWVARQSLSSGRGEDILSVSVHPREMEGIS